MVFFLIFMHIHVLFTRSFNLDSCIWHLSEKVPQKYEAPHSPDFECALKWYTNTVYNLKKDHLQPLQTILHRIGPFVSFLARYSARTHTPLRKVIQFERPVQRRKKKLFLLKNEGEPLNWAS